MAGIGARVLPSAGLRGVQPVRRPRWLRSRPWRAFSSAWRSWATASRSVHEMHPLSGTYRWAGRYYPLEPSGRSWCIQANLLL